MTGHEERRKIARKLRAAAAYLPNDIDSEDLEMAIATTVCNYDVPNVETLFNRLAELVEPEPERTCRMIDNGCELCCSECDERHDYDEEPNYCHNCGTRVVDDDNR